MNAAITGSRSLVQLLLEAQVELDAVDPTSGCTAFHLSCYYNAPRCARLLVRAGCDTGIANAAGDTGWEIADTRCPGLREWRWNVKRKRERGKRKTQRAKEAEAEIPRPTEIPPRVEYIVDAYGVTGRAWAAGAASRALRAELQPTECTVDASGVGECVWRCLGVAEGVPWALVRSSVLDELNS